MNLIRIFECSAPGRPPIKVATISEQCAADTFAQIFAQVDTAQQVESGLYTTTNPDFSVIKVVDITP